MESEGHPNRCASAVFGRIEVGYKINAMGLLSCAGWRDPEIFMGRKSSYDGDRIFVDRGSSLRLAVSAMMDVSKYGSEGYPINQKEADSKTYEDIGDTCAIRGLCVGCERFVEGTPVFLNND